MGKQAHDKKPASTVRLAHSQTGSGADRVWGLRKDLSQEVCWTRPWGHIFNMSQLWMTYRHSAKGVCVCVCVHACMCILKISISIFPGSGNLRSRAGFLWLYRPRSLQLQAGVCGNCDFTTIVWTRKKIVGKSIICSKWKFYGSALWVVYRWRMLSSLVIFFFLLQFFEEGGCWSRRGKSKLASFALKARAL